MEPIGAHFGAVAAPCSPLEVWGLRGLLLRALLSTLQVETWIRCQLTMTERAYEAPTVEDPFKEEPRASP